MPNSPHFAQPQTVRLVFRRSRRCTIGPSPLVAASRLQLVFELVEEVPIGMFCHNLGWCRFDQTGFLEAQRIKPDRVLGVVLPPLVVWQLAQGLTVVIGSPDEAPIRNILRN